jgi:hypothetical protein
MTTIIVRSCFLRREVMICRLLQCVMQSRSLYARNGNLTFRVEGGIIPRGIYHCEGLNEKFERPARSPTISISSGRFQAMIPEARIPSALDPGSKACGSGEQFEERSTNDSWRVRVPRARLSGPEADSGSRRESSGLTEKRTFLQSSRGAVSCTSTLSREQHTCWLSTSRPRAMVSSVMECALDISRVMYARRV